MDAWFSKVKIHFFEQEDIQKYDPDLLSFRNVNTPEELESALHLAQQEPDVFKQRIAAYCAFYQHIQTEYKWRGPLRKRFSQSFDPGGGVGFHFLARRPGLCRNGTLCISLSCVEYSDSGLFDLNPGFAFYRLADAISQIRCDP